MNASEPGVRAGAGEGFGGEAAKPAATAAVPPVGRRAADEP
jgi:hypothetical protein